MNTKVTIDGSAATLKLIGRLDTPSAVALEGELAPVKDEGITSLLIDCSELAYISSSGMRIFFTLYKHFTGKGGSLVLKALNEEIKEVFEMTGFLSIYTVID